MYSACRMHQSEPDSEYEQHGEERWRASGPRHLEQDAPAQNSARSERRGDNNLNRERRLDHRGMVVAAAA